MNYQEADRVGVISPGGLRMRASGRHTLEAQAVCQLCGRIGDMEAHHDDHNKRLDVLWLCPLCHRRRDAELRAAVDIARWCGHK